MQQTPFQTLDVNNPVFINEQIKEAKSLKKHSKLALISMIISLVIIIAIIAVAIVTFLKNKDSITAIDHNTTINEFNIWKSESEKTTFAIVTAIIGFAIWVFGIWTLVEWIIISVKHSHLRWRYSHTTAIILAWVFTFILGIGFFIWIYLCIKLQKDANKYIDELAKINYDQGKWN